MSQTDTAKRPFYIRLAVVLHAIFLIVLLLLVGKSIIIPLFFSLLIALMLLPCCKWLERRGLPRGLSAILSLLVFIGFISALIYFLVRQIVDISRDLPQLAERMQGWLHTFQDWIAIRFGVDSSSQIAYLKSGALGMVRSASDLLSGILLGLTGLIIWTLFVFIFTFFILRHRTVLQRFVTALFSRQDQRRVADVLTESRMLANRYVLGLLIEMVIVAGLNCLAFYIFGIRYALLLGIIAAVFNIIPYLGIYTATGIAALVTLSNSTPGHALTVIICLLVVHFLDANVLLPRIMGARVKMNPLITIVAVLTGHLIWGIPGMFLFIPLVAILKIIFERVDGLKPWSILMGTEDTGDDLSVKHPVTGAKE